MKIMASGQLLGGVLCAGILGACAGNHPAPKPLTAADVEQLGHASALTGGMVKTTVKLHEKDKIMSTPSVTQRVGQTATIELVKELVYPTDFDLPKAPKSGHGGVPPITPTTPKKFTTKPLGIQITLTPRFEGGLVVLMGEVVISENAGFTHATSEVVARPIVASKDDSTVITANKLDLPMFREARTPIFVTALPGRSYTVEVMGLQGPIQAEFICEVEPLKKP